MFKLFVLLIVLTPCLTDLNENEWDYLMYSQRWPVTGCISWQNKNQAINTCNLPNDLSTWTVHGLWPTKAGTDGPNSCNSAIHFDPGQLQPIINELREQWINVENNTKPYSFWNHEWNKHGTCASVLPQLNSVYNYFNKGLDLNRQYNISKLLTASKVIPKNDSGFQIEYLYDLIQKALGKNPMIECVVEKNISLISEIRICFDKSFTLIDCNVTQSKDLMTNCSKKRLVMYYANVPKPISSIENPSENDDDQIFIEEYLKKFNYRNNLKKVYSIVKLLMWFTL